jgi:hypothetical protein
MGIPLYRYIVTTPAAYPGWDFCFVPRFQLSQEVLFFILIKNIRHMA